MSKKNQASRPRKPVRNKPEANKPDAPAARPDQSRPASQSTGQVLVDLQGLVGNQSVQRLLQKSGEQNWTAAQALHRQPSSTPAAFSPIQAARLPSLQVLRQPLLSPAEEADAIGYSKARYESKSVRLIQIITGANVDGDFGSATAQAVADFQDAHPPLDVDGKVGENTLNIIVPAQAGAGNPENAIQLVTDFYNLDVASDTLSVQFDTGLLVPSDTDFESGNLRVIRVGAVAFTSATDLRAAIQAGLSVAAPAFVPAGPRPDHLTPAEEQAAIQADRAALSDRRAVLAVQGLVDTNPDGLIGSDTVERIAEFQANHGLADNGILDEATVQEMVELLDVLGEQNAAIRLIIDFFNISEHHALLDIAFDSTVASNATTSGEIPGPSIVRIGPKAFARGFAALVHTIAHELEHVRQRREGILSQDVREFLGEAIEIISLGMPEEDLAGFMSDARRALNFWNNMTPAEQAEHFARFEEVRDQVRRRHNAASPADQATHQATRDAYDAVAAPVPAGP